MATSSGGAAARPVRARKRPHFFMESTDQDEHEGEARLLEILATSRRLLVFTGSGISATSGLTTFSDAGGLYERARKRYGLKNGAELFHYRFFKKRPEDALAFLAEVCVIGRLCVARASRWRARARTSSALASSRIVSMAPRARWTSP